VFTEQKCTTKKRNRFYGAKLSLANAKTGLQNVNLAHKGTNAFTEWLEEQKYAIDWITEINHLLHVRKRLYREKTSLSKAKTPFSSENAITDLKRGSQRRKRVYLA